MSDNELYEETKSLFVREHFSGKSQRCLDYCYDECLRRNERIFACASKDALFLINSLENYMKELRAVNIRRLDFMTNAEIHELVQKIGASPVFPITSERIISETTLLDFIGISRDNFVICTVSGASMESRIEDGDELFVDIAEKPENGKIVVADIDGNLLVKRYLKKNGKIRLVSDNPAFPPIDVNENMNFAIYGVVKRIIKIA